MVTVTQEVHCPTELTDTFCHISILFTFLRLFKLLIQVSADSHMACHWFVKILTLIWAG